LALEVTTLGGLPQIEASLRALIRQMSRENPLWGAPRIHGELLLKLGFEVAQSSVAKYMVKRRGPLGQGWLTFLRNHAPDIAAMDLFVVLTIGFDLLYAFVIVRIDRRDLVWINVAKNPTAEWGARQIAEAFPWDSAPGYMIRDRDRICGGIVTRRLHAMGTRDKPTSQTADRVDPAQVLGSYHRFWRGPSAAGFCDPTRAITTTSERIGHWTKMRRSLVRFSGPDASNRSPSSADSITTMRAFEFSVHTAGCGAGVG
jgi:hypothetical protein